MHVEVLGDGDPEVSVVGAVHGDEPCGADAVRALADEAPDVERPVALVLANEQALERDVRYVDEDLNRVFPGDPEGETHESRLAAAVGDVIAGTETLVLHSTQSHPEPFAIVQTIGASARRIVPRLSVEALVHAGPPSEGRVFEVVPDAVEVECGLQGSDGAAANARRIAREFLGATGALPDATGDPIAQLPVFELGEPIPKHEAGGYDVFVENFEAVGRGEPFAAVDGEPVVADEPFHPVLMSPEGYEDVFGYRADRVGTLSAPD